MFQRLTDLLFGRQRDSSSPEAAVLKSGRLDGEEEDWLLVSIPDGEALAELDPVAELGVLSTTSVSRSVVDSTKAIDDLVSTNSVEDPEARPGLNRARPVSKAKAVRTGRRLWARARADRFHLGHHCIQRQNRVRQRLPRHTSRTHPMILHQPTHRNFCH